MDVVGTVPKADWDYWMSEGTLPGEPPPEDTEYHWILRVGAPKIQLGERVYIVARGKLRGYAPLTAIRRDCEFHLGTCLAREGGAVALTLGCLYCVRNGVHVGPPDCYFCKGSGIREVRGFRGIRYRWWDRLDELPFPAWRTP